MLHSPYGGMAHSKQTAFGSFYCSCGIGYARAIDESNCNDYVFKEKKGVRVFYIPVDINECLQNGGLGPCQQMCTNTNGSFFCSCRAGYMLGFNQSECIGKAF